MSVKVLPNPAIDSSLTNNPQPQTRDNAYREDEASEFQQQLKEAIMAEENGEGVYEYGPDGKIKQKVTIGEKLDLKG